FGDIAVIRGSILFGICRFQFVNSECRSMIQDKPAPTASGLDTGFRKRSCTNKKLEAGFDSNKTDKALS
ncbi:MAG TPA: hypothetical protein VHY10_19730, partial [Xanthobacteraceae bacterium]|nr:hypothetical protein [Xanthobacteraceae bacterium]